MGTVGSFILINKIRLSEYQIGCVEEDKKPGNYFE